MKNNQNLSLWVQAFATVFLVIVTILYLYETRSIRKNTEDSFRLDYAPQVFIKKLSPQGNLNISKKRFELSTILFFTNTGKTPAKNLKGTYTIQTGESKIKNDFGPFLYLFPGQEFNYQTPIQAFNIPDKSLDAIKWAISKNIPFEDPSTFLEIYFFYLDQESKEQTFKFKYRYVIGENVWVYLNQ